MLLKIILLFVASTLAAPTGLQLLFPSHHQHKYWMTTTICAGVDSKETCNRFPSTLSVIVTNNFTKARLQLEQLWTHSDQNNTFNETHKYLYEPWEVDYSESGTIDAIFFGSEPVWSQNVKRALSLNFQVVKKTGTYEVNEPCLHHLCHVIYTTSGDSIRKYTTQKVVWYGTEYQWSSIPMTSNYGGPGYPESMALAETQYKVDDNKGLITLDQKGTFQYRVNDTVLSTTIRLTLSDMTQGPIPVQAELSLAKTSIQYVTSDCSNPTNGFRNYSQSYLKNKTYRILLKIATKGIDADNIVRNSTLIHNLDFSILLSTISQLDYDHLVLLFGDLVLGTSYEIETARNIFLEMVPHAKTNACARFIVYLVVEKKEKLEDAAIIALIRKLSFNAANYHSLLEELEVLTRLGGDFSPEIRRVGILSYANLVRQTQNTHNEASCCSNFVDYVVVKYFRMYSDCPQYIDRLTWLQGLCNIGAAAQAYTDVIYGDTSKEKHERLWAALSRSEGYEAKFEVLKTNLPILRNDTEHIQLRIIAVHNILSSATITDSDFLFVHNYIMEQSNNQLKNFWYSSVMSMQKHSGVYKLTSTYVPFISHEIPPPDGVYWATGNRIFGDGVTSLQLISVGGDSMMPDFVAVKVKSGGLRPYRAAVYIVGQGVTEDLYKEFRNPNTKEGGTEQLTTVLQKLLAWGQKVPDKVHIDIVVKVQDTTVYATHLNQTRKYFSDAMVATLDFLRLGSHINQQMLHIPSQMDVHVPSILGTPIRLHSSSTSFVSIRGNLSASENSQIKNDLHLRYQGIFLTSLSTDLLFQPSELITRLQTSEVAHIPMKFNYYLGLHHADYLFNSFHPNKGGVAMHSRKEIILLTEDIQDLESVVKEKKWNWLGENFTDCKNNGSFANIMTNVFGIKAKGDFSLLDPISKSLYFLFVFLKQIFVSTHPSTDSCGLVLPIQEYEIVTALSLRLRISIYAIDEFIVQFTPELKYYRTNNLERPLQTFTSTVALKNTKTKLNFTFLTSHYPANESYISRHIIDYDPRIDQDITDLYINYNGTTSLTSTSRNQNKEIYNMKYRFDCANVSSHCLKTFTLNMNKTITISRFDARIKNLLMSFMPDDNIFDAIRTYSSGLDFVDSFTMKEVDGQLSIENGNNSKFLTKSPLPFIESLTIVQRMKKIGLYKECRMDQSDIVYPMQGGAKSLTPHQCNTVLLADCTTRPEFAILQLKDGGFRIHWRDAYVDLNNGEYTIVKNPDSSNETEYFTIEQEGFVTKLSTQGNIDVYYIGSELTILLPSVYMGQVCGECTGSPVPSVC